MKPAQIAILTVALLFAGCQKPSDPVAPAKTEPPATPEPIAVTVPAVPAPTLTIPPEPEAIPVPSTPPPKPTASLDFAPPPTPKQPEPDVIYFAIQRISVPTPDGVYSIPPGTQLSLVRTVGPILIVSDGKTEFEAQPTQLTNDLDVATRIANLDETAKRRLAAERAARALQAQQQQSLTIEEMQQMVELAKQIQDLRNKQQQEQSGSLEQQKQMLDLIQQLQGMKRRR